jgi:hypothetical protein
MQPVLYWSDTSYDVTSDEKENRELMENNDATSSEEKIITKFDVPEDNKEAMHEKHGNSVLEKKKNKNGG